LPIALAWLGCAPDPSTAIRNAAGSASDAALTITNPLDSALFPPEAPAPAVRWTCTDSTVRRWAVGQTAEAGKVTVAALVDTPCWQPTPSQWNAMKRASLGQQAMLTVVGLGRGSRVLHLAHISFSTSPDSVRDAIFYREVNLPFAEAVKDPSKIRWRFGTIEGPQAPPVVLTGLPVCGNCHSFSADGAVLGMDVDYANDKGSYAVVETAPEIALSRDRVISWGDYRREDNQPTFGLLSQVSPDGRYVVSTVKDRSVFVPKPDLAFSQLFFPVQGILAIHDCDKRTFRALPGADNPQLVQSNASWSPDGRTIVFARAQVHHLRGLRETASALLSSDECSEFLVEKQAFRFDLCRIDFAAGAGGTAGPIPGASGNGVSNFFARYSPDGRWIVFCQAANYMLLQPDSRLFIMPAEGGTPRLMRCNRGLMNSWHSWSSNGRWLVFASKANGPYTQLWLTHVDPDGADAVPVLLEHLTEPDRAANIPEFTRLGPGAIRTMREQFVDDVSWVRAGRESGKVGGYQEAARKYAEALRINPNNARAHAGLGMMLVMQKRLAEATLHFRTAVQLQPDYADAHYNLAMALEKAGVLDTALSEFSAAVRLDPRHSLAWQCLGNIHHRKGAMDSALACYRRVILIVPDQPAPYFSAASVLQRRGRTREAADMYLSALKVDSAYVPALYNYGVLLHEQGKLVDALRYYRRAVTVDPGNALAFYSIARALHELGKPGEAVPYYRRALELKPDFANAKRQLDAAVKDAAGQAPTARR